MSERSLAVESLQSESALERFLSILGHDPEGPVKQSTSSFIRCPMPGHVDAHPSCSVIADGGFFVCRSQCGTILAKDLVQAYGHASSGAEALAWIEDQMGVKREPVRAAAKVDKHTDVDDPTLTVENLLARFNLPESTRSKFFLEDVQVWHAGRDADDAPRGALYESDWYTSVLIPYGVDVAPDGHELSGRPICLDARARVRSDRPGGTIRPVMKVRRLVNGVAKRYDLELMPGRKQPITLSAYGLAQFERVTDDPTLDLRRTMLVIEGESDVWSSHAMNFTAAIGVPGATNGRHAAKGIANAVLVLGDGSSADVRVVIWQEPGAAGSKFPGRMAEAVAKVLDKMGMPAPKFITLDPAVSFPTIEELDDVRDLWMRMGTDAGPLLRRALAGALPSAEIPTSALDLMPADPFVKPARSGAEDWDSATVQDCPDLDHLCGTSINAADRTFTRTEHGWSVETTVKTDDGFDTKLKTVCSPFVITRVDVCGDEEHATICSPRTIGAVTAWRERRVKLSIFSSTDRGSATLIGMGVQPWHRQKSAMLDLALVLANRVAELDGIQKIPFGTGWVDEPGVSLFAGIETESADDMPQMMFDANNARRAVYPDEHAAAAEWWEKVAAPLTSAVEAPRPCHAAPMVALGTSAAAPLLGILTAMGIRISPVTWMSGKGGGGKTVTLTACASIFAPDDGQCAFYSSSDMSRAALNARAAYSRDLPFLLDDVTQVPPMPGSTLRGDAAKIEAAALLAMSIFNRKPTERANREGGLRKVKPYRSTAVFTAEAPLSRTSASTLSAGQIRRVANIEASPMNDRGLPQPFSEVVSHQSSKNGGAPGALLIKHIRTCVKGGSIRSRFDACKRMISSLDPDDLKEQTQTQALAVSVLGFVMLGEACGAGCLDELIAIAGAILDPYLNASSEDGGAVTSEDIGGGDAALASIESLIASHAFRFKNTNTANLEYVDSIEYYGGFIKPEEDGGRRVVLLHNAMKKLYGTYGVSTAQIQELVDRKLAFRAHRIRLSTDDRPRGIMFLLGPDDDTAEHHDPPPTPPTPPPTHTVSTRTFKLRLPHGAIVDEEKTIPVAQPQSEEDDVATFRWSDGMYQRHGQTALEDETQVRREAEAEMLALREAFAADGIEVLDAPADNDAEKWARIESLGDEAPGRLWSKCVAVGIAIQNPDLAPADLLELKREHVRIYRIILMLRMCRPDWFLVEAPL